MPSAASIPPLSLRDAFWISSLQVLGSFGILRVLSGVVSISGPASLALYLVAHGVSVWNQPYFVVTLPSIWSEVVRDGPTLRKDAGLFSLVTHAPPVLVYVAPIALGSLLSPGHRVCLWWLAVLGAKWAWAEYIPRVGIGVWRRDPMSCAMAVAAVVYFRYDWRLVVLAVVRRSIPYLFKYPIVRLQFYDDMPLHSYTSIPGSERTIRLLKLEPGFFGMRCSFVYHDLAAARAGTMFSYDAISCHWETGEKPNVVMIEGMALRVPEVVFDVIRHRASLWRTRLLWIDAACINQDDIDERSQQVRLMRDIYSQAARTIVWLGSDNSVNAAIASAFLSDLMVQQGGGKVSASLDAFNTKASRWVNGGDQNPRWSALVQMLDRPYFTHVWMVQQIAVSRQVHISWGGMWYDWELFASTIGSLTAPTSRIRLPQELDVYSPPFQTMKRIDSIHKLRVDYQQGKPTPSLSSLLATFPGLQTQLAQDHVFALVGIGNAAQDDVTITINYRRSALDVYTDAVLYSLGQSPHLTMFSMAGTKSSQEPGWPSWVPDFHRLSQFGPPPPSILASFPGYEASGGSSSHDVRVTTDGGIELHLTAVLVDAISHITTFEPAPRESEGEWMGLDPEAHPFFSFNRMRTARTARYNVARIREAERLCESVCDVSYPYPGGDQDRWEAFWRTCLCNQSPPPSNSDRTLSYPADASYGEQLRGFIEDQERNAQTVFNMLDIVSPPDLVSLIGSGFPKSKTPGTATTTAEEMIQTLENVFPFVKNSERGRVRDCITPDLLNSPDSLFREVVKATYLPLWARKRIRDGLFLASGNDDDTTSTNINTNNKDRDKDNKPQWQNAIQELCTLAFDFPTDRGETVRRVVLAAAFLTTLAARPHLSRSDIQIIQSMAREAMMRHDRALMVPRAAPDQGRSVEQVAGGTFFDSGRKFALTGGPGGSRMMALVPCDAEVGDLVCVFRGAKVPFVVRRVVCGDGGEVGKEVADGDGDRDRNTGKDMREDDSRNKGGDKSRSKDEKIQKYRLVGEAYVHGLMDGLAWDGTRRAERIALV